MPDHPPPQGASSLRSGLVAAVPIALGCFPIALSFGLAASRVGLTAPEALAMSVNIDPGLRSS